MDYYLVEHVVYQYLLPAVCIPGVCAAALSAVIFARMRQTSLEVLLCGLSIFDVLLLTCTLLIYPAIHSCGQQENQMNSLVCHFFWKSALLTFPISVIAQTGSVWTCVAVTLDRFIAVSYPIRKRVLCTPNTSLAVLLGVTFFSVIFKIPAFLEIQLNEAGVLVDTDLRKNQLYQKIYMTYLYTAIIVVVPWTIIIVLNVIVIRKVRIAYQIQANMTLCRPNNSRCRREEGERKVTVMATVMTGIFILCNIPPTLCNSVESFLPDLKQNFRPIIPLSNLLVCVNSASNMLIYCVFNQKFRRAVIKIFRKNKGLDKGRLPSRREESKTMMRESSTTAILVNDKLITRTTMNSF
ncbi:unnamed protein product [Auanema sp. JU1783]|nr:unnamed protein product [Auanema sp. JU1783]